MPVRETEDKNKAQTGAKKTVKKNPFEERLKKFLENVQKGLTAKIHQIKCVKVSEPGEPKVDMGFLVFSKNGAKDTEIDREYNVEVIKDVLFHYHTAPEKPTANPAFLQVVNPVDEDSPYMLTYQEYSDK